LLCRVGLLVLLLLLAGALIFVIVGEENADVDDAATTTVDVGESVGHKVRRSIASSREEAR
jgi:hypothetical protein